MLGVRFYRFVFGFRAVKFCIPFWMERVTSYVEARHFCIGDLYAFGISVAIEFTTDRKGFFAVVLAISAIAT